MLEFWIGLDYTNMHSVMIFLNVNRIGLDGVHCYFLGEKGYPLINWVMTPFKEEGQHTILKFLCNKKHKRGQVIVDNTCGMKKKPSNNYWINQIGMLPSNLMCSLVIACYTICLGLKMKSTWHDYFIFYNMS